MEAMTLQSRTTSSSSLWDINARKIPLTQSSTMPNDGAFRSHADSEPRTVSQKSDAHMSPSFLIQMNDREDKENPRASVANLGQPQANVNLADIQAQAELLEQQSRHDHEEAQRLAEQQLRQMFDNKGVRVTHACEHCRHRKAKCTGQQPCLRCTKQGRLCTFSRVERKKKVTGNLRDFIGTPQYSSMAEIMPYPTSPMLRPHPVSPGTPVRNTLPRYAMFTAPYGHPRSMSVVSATPSASSDASLYCSAPASSDVFDGPFGTSFRPRSMESGSPAPPMNQLTLAVPVEGGELSNTFNANNLDPASCQMRQSYSPAPLAGSLPGTPAYTHLQLPTGAQSSPVSPFSGPARQCTMLSPAQGHHPLLPFSTVIKRSSLSQVWDNTDTFTEPLPVNRSASEQFQAWNVKTVPEKVQGHDQVRDRFGQTVTLEKPYAQEIAANRSVLTEIPNSINMMSMAGPAMIQRFANTSGLTSLPDTPAGSPSRSSFSM